ncbi:hypothetical protein Spock_71 [Bacillus phage Spock]|uniref:Uncharacterized protein n=2 Tax=Bequatrovirus spock TaxID=1918008 RepID=A0A1X9SFT6_9CAUD|nr:hypothetical protein Spock_71 [Bacillus phage Spock]AGY48471.1 hypothetical protein Spock_71 [Bacillus phage Spock]ARQ94985.1 hypothetical protein FLAPJACK_71 [Bacillus phage Flapjack]
MTNYEKGLLDGYRIALYNKLPRFGCEGDDTPEYKQGIRDGQVLQEIDYRKKTWK